MNSHRIASKALQIMQLRSGNAMKATMTAWKAYMTLEAREKGRCDRHAERSLLRQTLKKWIYEVKIMQVSTRARVCVWGGRTS